MFFVVYYSTHTLLSQAQDRLLVQTAHLRLILKMIVLLCHTQLHKSCFRDWI